jgi:hypothetical protein
MKRRVAPDQSGVENSTLPGFVPQICPGKQGEGNVWKRNRGLREVLADLCPDTNEVATQDAEPATTTSSCRSTSSNEYRCYWLCKTSYGSTSSSKKKLIRGELCFGCSWQFQLKSFRVLLEV